MGTSIKDRVAIIGIGCTKFGDNFDLSYEDMAAEAVFQALDDAKIEAAQIDAGWLGTFSPGQGYGKASVSLADAIKIYDKPLTRVENYCATGTDAFRNAAMGYAGRLQAAVPPEPPAIPRLGITVVGQGVTAYDQALFRKLSPHGAYFKRVKPENGLQQLLSTVAARAKAHPAAYGPWYVDGGQASDHHPALTCVSYGALEPARTALLRRIRSETDKPGMGPEALRTVLAQLRPADIGLGKADDAVLDRFQLKVLTEGSGTQIFSTTFAQWTAREVLRRAQPLTLLVRFAPRQRQKPMNELLSGNSDRIELDPVGSLVDGDMSAYYNWLNQQRLPGAEQSSFLVWFEDHSDAVAIGPSMARGTVSNAAASIGEVLSWMS